MAYIFLSILIHAPHGAFSQEEGLNDGSSRSSPEDNLRIYEGYLEARQERDAYIALAESPLPFTAEAWRHSSTVQEFLRQIDFEHHGDEARLLPVSEILMKVIKDRPGPFDRGNEITIKREGALIEVIVRRVGGFPPGVAGDPLLIHLWIDGFTGQELWGAGS